MIKLAEVVVVPMDDDGCAVYGAGLETAWLCATDDFRKTERDEANDGHEAQDNEKETNLLAPCSLLLWCTDA